ncbi:hypothetical protein PENTCL1PPCAC_15692, partial [Pristionchus entomophagus]
KNIKPKMRRRNREDSMSDDEFESLSVNDAPTHDWDSLSAFESLPKELVWKIMDFVPEAVFDMRMTSWMLRSRVDEYACQVTRLIDSELVLRKVSSQSRESFFSGTLIASKSQSRLFELRLQLRKPHRNFNKRIKRINQRRSFGSIRPNEYEYRFELDSFFDEASSIQYLRECLGMQIKKAKLVFEIDGDQPTVVSKLFEGVQIRKLELRVDNLSDNVA